MSASLDRQDFRDYWYDYPASLARKREELESERDVLVRTAPINDLDELLSQLALVCVKLDALQILENEVSENARVERESAIASGG